MRISKAWKACATFARLRSNPLRMKNQYFGDINDYRKYGLLRAIIRASDMRVLVAWMLTPDDGSGDGRFTAYLTQSERWAKHDSVLYQQLQVLTARAQERNVRLIEATDLLRHANYYTDLTPDGAAAREQWFRVLLGRSTSSDLVLLDPDNGIEVKSKPYGNRHSSKYAYWPEIEGLWNAGKSLMIYQHFVREKRSNFIQKVLQSLKQRMPDSTVEAFSTSHVVFFMVLQPRHNEHQASIVQEVDRNWAGQIACWNRPGMDASLR